MSKQYFVSVDPSLSNTAIVWGTIDDNNKITPLGYKLAHSEKGKDKKVPVMEDRVNRIRAIFEMVDEVLEEFKPTISFGEYPSGSQSSSASVSLGISCSVLAKLPNFIGVTPMDVKKVVGKGVITKKDIMDYCEANFPYFPYERKKDGTMVAGRMEHICDSIIIGVAGIKKMNK